MFDPSKIGGSDVAVLLGLSTYSQPIDIWRRIVEGRERPSSPAAERGKKLEPYVREMARTEFGLAVVDAPEIVCAEPWMRASLDGMTIEGEVVEIKTVNERKRYDWAAGVPDYYVPQVQWYLHHARAELAHVVALVGLDDLRHEKVTRDDAVIEAGLDAARRFYADHITTKRPPPPDFSDAYGAFLRDRFPLVGGTPEIAATAEAEAWAEKFFDARDALAKAKNKLQEAENNLLFIADGSSLVRGSGWTLRTTRVATAKTDWEAVARKLGAQPEDIQPLTRDTSHVRLTMRRQP